MVIDTISYQLSLSAKANLFLHMHVHKMKLTFHVDKLKCQLSFKINIFNYIKIYTVAHKAGIISL